ncbi:MAG: S66 peptidase family protein [Acidimicrobiia bacterium]
MNAPGVFPPPLRPGDVVAVVAPAGPVHELSLHQGVAVLEAWGLRVRISGSITARHGYLAGSDERRAAELAAAFAEPNVRAIWCARGGYGVTRIADAIAEAVRTAADPKWIVGFSDVTALHRIVRAECNWVTLHATGVEGLGRFGPDAVASSSARGVLFGEQEQVRLRGTTIRAGSVDGVIDGGNLAMLAALCGTRWALDAVDLLFTEDVNERPYRIDRLLTQVLDAASVRALAFGQFTNSGEDLDRHGAFSVNAVLDERSTLVSGPSVRDLSVGHIEGANHAVPLGASARLDDDLLAIAAR